MRHFARAALSFGLAFAPHSLVAQTASTAPVQPPVIVAPPMLAAPAPAPVIPLPKPSANQLSYLRNWLASGASDGVRVGSTPSMLADSEGLVRAALVRAKALRSGALAPSDYLDVWSLRAPAYDPLPDFAKAVASDTLPQWVASLAPRYPGYAGLKKGLANYEAIRAAGGWKTIAAGVDSATLRARLAMEDRGLTSAMTDVVAIQRAQKRYGLNPTGQLDARTLAELNVPVQQRIDSIVANLERWRWLPASLPSDRIQVNIAAAVLSIIRDDQVVMSMRAVTGSPKNQTPMLTSTIRSIVVNPPWNVPSSIAQKELWPKGRAALIASGYQIVGPKGAERIVQPAGPKSSLGRLKFDFENPFAVYLHDTPSRGRFASFDRLASHGCVRLEKPIPLAELLLQNDPAYAGKVQSLIDTGKTMRISLTRPSAVYLLYWTAFSSQDGTLNFRSDPYGWDRLLASKIGAPGTPASATVAQN